MRFSLPLVILAMLLGGASPERLGVGVATVSVDAGVRIALFETHDATEPVAYVEIVEVQHDLRLSDDSPDWLRPDVLWLDYYLFAFRVLTVTDTALEIVVDTESGRSLWMRSHPAVEYKPWAQYLVENVTGLERLDPDGNPLRVASDQAAATIPFAPSLRDGWECLAVAEVQGEWLRVRRSDLCVAEEAPPLDGWIRWRDGETLLISYGLTC